jgi:diaminopimelate decarboxylase
MMRLMKDTEQKKELMPPARVGGDGTVSIGGVGVLRLAERYGTPLFVTDEKRVRENFRRLRQAFQAHYSRFRVNYAVKSNNNLAILGVLRSEGAGADCSSLEEIALARMAGFDVSDILYTGNYNSDGELRGALSMGVAINLDDVDMLPRLLRFGKPEVLSFRVNPGIGAGSHPGIVTAGENAKFGSEEHRLLDAYRFAKESGVRRFGIHMMTGSNVLDQEYFVMVSSKLIAIAENIAKKAGISFEFVDIGGGFGVPYRPDEQPLDIEAVGRDVASLFRRAVESQSFGEPYLMVEPGRFIVADSTVLLGRVHHIKHSYSRVYVGTDIGMNTLVRPELYGAYHHVYLARAPNAEPTSYVTITGQICENTDALARDRPFPQVEVGDVIVVMNAGAYGFSMSSQYNTRPRAAEVLVNEGQDELIRERESVFDLVFRQRVPQRLLR